MLFLHTTSPFEAKDRGAEMENGAHRAKSLPRAGGEQGGGSGRGGSSLLSPSPRPRDARGEAFWSLPRLVAPSILGCRGPGQGVVVPLFWQALGPASHRGSLVPKPNPRNQIRGAGLGLGGVKSAFLVAFCSLGLVEGLLPPLGPVLLHPHPVPGSAANPSPLTPDPPA